MIEVQSLSKRFTSGKGKKRREVQAVGDVSFHAPNGSITGLLGPNGAGKSTTLRMISGLIQPDAGSINVDGIDVLTTPYAALKRMGVLSDARGLYARLTARENIIYYGRLHNMSEEDANARAELLAGLLEMRPLLDRRCEGFSTGEKMKTALARALVHDPVNVILDEPTNGLDVIATRSLREVLLSLKRAGKCVVISTHIMQEVERLCESVTVVANGRSIATGSVPQLLASTEQTNFEEAFVRLAYPNPSIPAQAQGAAHA